MVELCPSCTDSTSSYLESLRIAFCFSFLRIFLNANSLFVLFVKFFSLTGFQSVFTLACFNFSLLKKSAKFRKFLLTLSDNMLAI